MRTQHLAAIEEAIVAFSSMIDAAVSAKKADPSKKWNRFAQTLKIFFLKLQQAERIDLTQDLTLIMAFFDANTKSGAAQFIALRELFITHKLMLETICNENKSGKRQKNPDAAKATELHFFHTPGYLYGKSPNPDALAAAMAAYDENKEALQAILRDMKEPAAVAVTAAAKPHDSSDVPASPTPRASQVVEKSHYLELTPEEEAMLETLEAMEQRLPRGKLDENFNFVVTTAAAVVVKPTPNPELLSDKEYDEYLVLYNKFLLGGDPDDVEGIIEDFDDEQEVSSELNRSTTTRADFTDLRERVQRQSARLLEKEAVRQSAVSVPEIVPVSPAAADHSSSPATTDSEPLLEDSNDEDDDIVVRVMATAAEASEIQGRLDAEAEKLAAERTAQLDPTAEEEEEEEEESRDSTPARRHSGTEAPGEIEPTVASGSNPNDELASLHSALRNALKEYKDIAGESGDTIKSRGGLFCCFFKTDKARWNQITALEKLLIANSTQTPDLFKAAVRGIIIEAKSVGSRSKLAKSLEKHVLGGEKVPLPEASIAPEGPQQVPVHLTR